MGVRPPLGALRRVRRASPVFRRSIEKKTSARTNPYKYFPGSPVPNTPYPTMRLSRNCLTMWEHPMVAAAQRYKGFRGWEESSRAYQHHATTVSVNE